MRESHKKGPIKPYTFIAGEEASESAGGDRAPSLSGRARLYDREVPRRRKRMIVGSSRLTTR